SAESVYELAKGIEKAKMDQYEELKVNTGRKDSDGNDIYELPPTVMIIDSVATMFSSKIVDEDVMGGQMDVTAQAKTNNQTIKRLSGSSTLSNGNIIIIAVNHITTKIDINPMQKAPADINYLKNTESVPGGSSFLYMANSMIKINPKDKLDPEGSSNQQKFGIKGYVSEIEIIKSRTSEAGRKVPIIYSQKDGFLNSLTNLNILKELNLLKGSPRSYYIEGKEDVKFTMKKFKSIYEENTEFAEFFDNYMKDVLRELIPDQGKLDNEEAVNSEDGSTENLTFKVVNEEEGIYKGCDGKYYDEDRNEIEVEEE